MKQLIALTCAVLASFVLRANDEDSLTKEIIKYAKFADSVTKAMKYETGLVKLGNGVAQVNVPQGFKFLNAEQSKFVISEVWGNPPDNDVLGMIFPGNGGPMADSNYAFVITYEAEGYVKDKDADDLNYDDMLKQMQTGEVEANQTRKLMGYPSMHLVGWAEKPFYDKANKRLHWAKELQFDGNPSHTLNYNVRILGRKGVLVMNAVAGMSELPLVKQDIEKVLQMPAFTAGNTYADFDSNVDEVAAYGIGGLIAGKLLLKAAGGIGFFAKFGKIIIFGIAAIGGLIFKFFRRKKPEQDVAYQAPSDGQPNA
jgi:uncharacterized membrane-anchored protein